MTLETHQFSLCTFASGTHKDGVLWELRASWKTYNSTAMCKARNANEKPWPTFNRVQSNNFFSKITLPIRPPSGWVSFALQMIKVTLNRKYLHGLVYTQCQDIFFGSLFLFNYILPIRHKTKTPYCLNINKPVGKPQEHQSFQDCCVDEIIPIGHFSIHFPAAAICSALCWISKIHNWTTVDFGCPLALCQQRQSIASCLRRLMFVPSFYNAFIRMYSDIIS